jgi:argininosuccinate lyase
MGKDIYRSRIEKPLNQKVLNFLSSLKEDLWIAEEDIIGTEVHNIMLYEQGILSKIEIKKILNSLENIKRSLLNGQLDLDYNFEDIHPFIEKCVIDEIGIDIGGKIHTGRSRNDQVSVDLRLKIRFELNLLSEKLMHLINVLIKLSKKTTETFMPLYTHLQVAQLGVFAHYINNYIAQIIRSLERIEEIYHRINKNPLGACAIGGTSININRKRTAELLGFEGVIVNSIDAISSRDYIYETLMCLSLISIQFSRISEDLLIWSTKEFEFVELDDQYCSVSSVMPQKRNPDTLELIRSKSSRIVGNLFSASIIIKAIPSGYFRDFQELKMLLKNSLDIIFSINDMLTGIFNTIKINEVKMIKVINESFILALDFAERLVHDYNIPFRQSHKIVAELIRNSQNSNDIFNKNKIETSIFKIYKKKITLPNNFIESLKNYKLCLENRISEGAPSILEVRSTIKNLSKKIELTNSLHSKRVENLKTAKELREKLIKELIL